MSRLNNAQVLLLLADPDEGKLHYVRAQMAINYDKHRYTYHTTRKHAIGTANKQIRDHPRQMLSPKCELFDILIADSKKMIHSVLWNEEGQNNRAKTNSRTEGSDT